MRGLLGASGASVRPLNFTVRQHWKEHRQSEAKSVMLTVVSDPSLHPSLKQIIHKIYSDEATLSPLLKSLDVRVALLNARGQAVEEYRLGARGSSGAA